MLEALKEKLQTIYEVSKG